MPCARRGTELQDDIVDINSKLTVVMVVYNSMNVIKPLLERLQAFNKVIIVDNNSTDDTVNEIRRLKPDATIIEHSDNDGFGFASNMGFAHAKTKYILHVNPDAEISVGHVARLMKTAEENPNACGVAPLIKEREDRYDISVMGPGERHHCKLNTFPDGPFCTWFVMGALVLWRAEHIRTLGGYDTNFFLYNEDADLCQRAVKAGYHLVLEPRAIALHMGGVSETLSWKTRWRKDWNLVWSHLYYEEKHGPAGISRQKALNSILPLFWKGTLGILRLRSKTVIGQFARLAATIRYYRGKPSWGRIGRDVSDGW